MKGLENANINEIFHLANGMLQFPHGLLKKPEGQFIEMKMWKGNDSEEMQIGDCLIIAENKSQKIAAQQCENGDVSGK